MNLFTKYIFISFIITRGQNCKLIFIAKTENYNELTTKGKKIKTLDYSISDSKNYNKSKTKEQKKEISGYMTCKNQDQDESKFDEKSREVKKEM